MKLPNASVRRIVADLVPADLGGDPRRTRRLVRMVSKLAKKPTATLPDVMASEAELEGAYRFVNNPHVTMSALHEAHAAQTARRARKEQRVLALHDTTPCECPHADPAHVGFLTTGKPGFYAHYSLVVGADSRRPLGVSYLEPIVRKKPPRRRKARAAKRRNSSGSQTRKKKNREFMRWQRGISATDQRLNNCEVIHIADRESDSYELMAQCLQAQRRFVFRVRIRERSIQLLNGDQGPLKELAARTEGVLNREVALATRKPRTAPRATKAHPPRKARLATLRFSATQIELRRPRYLGKAFPATLRLNLVRVWEPEPPPGEEPVEWLLFTTEPIDKPAQIEAVVDMYRARWLIEECNKALKSGCLIEQREFETREAMLNMLALSLPIACEILALRTQARENPDRPATDVLRPLQIRILRRVGSRKLSKSPTAYEALLAVAAIGGHKRSNGQPGWLILQRGMSKLLAYEVGWRAARGSPPADL
jgi:hypothetical protein